VRLQEHFSILVIATQVKSKIIKFLLKILGIDLSKVTGIFNVENPSKVDYKVIEKISEPLHFSYLDHQDGFKIGKTFQASHLISVKNIILDSKTGIAHNEKREIVSNTSAWSPEFLIASAQIRPGYFLPRFELPASESFISLSSNGYYHWLIEDLPIYLTLMQKSPSYVTLVARKCPPYVSSFLKYYEIPPLMVPRFTKVPNYSFVTRENSVGWPNPNDIKILRNFVEPIMSQDDNREKIFISRLNATRSTSFEYELTLLLESSGWKIVDATTLEFNEQVTLLSKADVLAGLHGAGLAGMVWMRPNTKVIELGPNRFVRCFNRLAEVLQIQYFRINYSNLKAIELFEMIEKI